MRIKKYFLGKYKVRIIFTYIIYIIFFYFFSESKHFYNIILYSYLNFNPYFKILVEWLNLSYMYFYFVFLEL